MNEITDSNCKCDSSSTFNECEVGKWCWSDNTCQENKKPNECAVSDLIAITGTPCQCAASSTIAECPIGYYCVTEKICSDNPSKIFVFFEK